MKKRTDDEKREILVQVGQLRKSEGLSIKALCKNLGISVVSYYNWKIRLVFPMIKRSQELRRQDFLW